MLVPFLDFLYFKKLRAHYEKNLDYFQSQRYFVLAY